MKRILCAALCALTLLSLSACGGKTQEAVSTGFKPALETKTSCRIVVAGSYKNFESLEAAFDRFNEYYPNVELTYTKLDDYNNIISTTLEGSSAPNIYVSYSWMSGREQYAPVFAHAEDLSDPRLGLDLSCLRSSILFRAEDGKMPMVPVFATTSGMLVNNSLFEKEGLKVPATYDEMVSVCAAFREKGYKTPILGYNGAVSEAALFTLAFPYFCSTVADNPAAVAALNDLDSSGGEYLRPALELVQRFLSDGCGDLDAWNTIEDSYSAVIMRFFEGDVPMMICTGDTVSGTKKRESQSEAFTRNPFTYSFAPVPVTAEGGYFLDSSNLQFSVNKDCDNLDMTNEFMRFLITSEQLGHVARDKRLLAPTRELSFDSVYAPFGQVPAERVISPEEFGLRDDPVVQFREAVYAVGNGVMTVDEAVDAFGTFAKS